MTLVLFCVQCMRYGQFSLGTIIGNELLTLPVKPVDCEQYKQFLQTCDPQAVQWMAKMTKGENKIL